MLFPTRCPVCEAPGPAPCPSCVAAMQAAPAFAPPDGVDKCVASLVYGGAARELVARLKYRNARASIGWLADAMAALVDEPVSAVVWVPTTPARRHRARFRPGRTARAGRRSPHRPAVPACASPPARRRSDRCRRHDPAERPPRARAATSRRGHGIARGRRDHHGRHARGRGRGRARRRRQSGHRAGRRKNAGSRRLTLTHGPVCRSVVASRCQSQAKRPT